MILDVLRDQRPGVTQILCPSCRSQVERCRQRYLQTAEAIPLSYQKCWRLTDMSPAQPSDVFDETSKIVNFFIEAWDGCCRVLRQFTGIVRRKIRHDRKIRQSRYLTAAAVISTLFTNSAGWQRGMDWTDFTEKSECDNGEEK